MIKLFQHNQEAYEACVSMLAEKGKAAVIHPTGTGKSFIGFKLCEDHPDKTICWLSPSEYIFKTQLENIADVSDGWVPKNIRFFTYAKLMLMTEDEMREIKPDHFIIDEYHRLGASQWGLYFNKLRSIYPDVPMLGLSATNIRYLDNQRDMAEELFDNNIASSMTLGEAIVRGILNPPKYVLSIYSYQDELEKLEARVRTTKNRSSKSEAEQYLEALRRALEKADGLDVMFQKNMDDRCGKYIVFCANFEHMQDIISTKINEWFHLVNDNVKIYTLYSGEADADRSFREFKEDDDRSALRLLFCIDALNEGVHVEDISGVILLRPTVSPIIYKQQIGRALSASKSTTPVIFDIVNNIENLYSIDSVKEEMQAAIRYFDRSGEGKMIVNERFDVIDKVAECRELFRQLEGTLSEGWELTFEKARDFYCRFGHLEVPKTAEYAFLYSWLKTQRRVYNGKARGTLTQSQIMKLDSIGMRWNSLNEANFEKYIFACKKYRDEHGDLLVPAKYKDGDINLGAFIASMRVRYKMNAELSEDKINILNELGMVWDVSEHIFEVNYALLLKYHKEHGDLKIPVNYIDPETDTALGNYCSNLRYKKETLSSEQIKKLDAIGFIWEGNMRRNWDEMFEYIRQICSEKGSLDGIMSTSKEGKWLAYQRENFKKGKLSADRISKLDAVGMVWDTADPWLEKFKLVEDYYREHGNLKIPYDHVVNGVWLNKWLNTQINAGEGKLKKALTEEQRKMLGDLGVTFDGKRHIDDVWEKHYEEAKKYFLRNGNLNISTSMLCGGTANLQRWVNQQKKCYQSGKLTEERRKRLEKIGISWSNVPVKRAVSEVRANA